MLYLLYTLPHTLLLFLCCQSPIFGLTHLHSNALGMLEYLEACLGAQQFSYSTEIVDKNRMKHSEVRRFRAIPFSLFFIFWCLLHNDLWPLTSDGWVDLWPLRRPLILWTVWAWFVAGVTCRLCCNLIGRFVSSPPFVARVSSQQWCKVFRIDLQRLIRNIFNWFLSTERDLYM